MPPAPLPSLNLVIAVTGASGSVYAVEFLRALARLVPGESSLIVSPAALRVYRDEVEESGGKSAEAFLEAALAPLGGNVKHSFRIEKYNDTGARPASGSAPYDGMVIVPSSMKTVAGVAHGYAANLPERAADVCLKEARRLVIVPRETPFNTIHLRNLLALSEAGAIILPANPGFYQKPASIDDLGRFIAGKILALFGVHDHGLFSAWDGDIERA